jgi:hypothetical protein
MSAGIAAASCWPWDRAQTVLRNGSTNGSTAGDLGYRPRDILRRVFWGTSSSFSSVQLALARGVVAGRVSVPFGVVEQVPYEAFALGSVAGNPPAGDIGQIDVHSASVADGLGGGQDEFVDIDGMAVLAEFVLVGFE